MKQALQYYKNHPADAAASLFVSLLFVLFFHFHFFGDISNTQYNYLYAKHAYLHPSFFLSHDISPLYTFFSAPFAQFGIKGVIVFNIICAWLTALYASSIAKNTGMRFTWMIAVLLVASPVYLLAVPGAGTGIFFGCWLSLVIWLFSENKPASSAFFASFLPFIETQGFWVILILFSILLIRKKYKIIPNLLFGFLLYSLLTYVFRDDYMLWTRLSLASGSPDADKAVVYISRMEIMFGIFVELLMLCGLVFLFRIKKLPSFSAPPLTSHAEDNVIYLTENVLIMGCFLALFLVKCWSAVSGVHNQEIADRQMVSLVPLVALLALKGINALHQRFLATASPRITGIVITSLCLLLFAIPLTRNIYPYKRSNEEKLAEKVSDWIRTNRNSYTKIYFNRPSYIAFLELDPVKGLDSYALNRDLLYDSIPAGSIIISEPFTQVPLANFFAEHLDNQSFHFKKIREFSLFDKNKQEEHKGEQNLDVILYVKRR